MSATTVEVVPSRPDPEVRPARQSYPPKYKLGILAELDAAENARLREQVAGLEERLAAAEELIDAQGKVSALLQRHSRKSAGPK